MTYAQLLQEGERTLAAAGIAEAKLDAWYLLSYVTGMSRAAYLLNCRDEIPAERNDLAEARQCCTMQAASALKGGKCTEKKTLAQTLQDDEKPDTAAVYRSLLAARSRHVPLQHLTGEQEFMGYPFLVNEHVLIPRQDTECLVEAAVKQIKKKSGNITMLDLCTGSGCIAVSLKKLLPKAHVTATDLSKEALAVAKENAGRLQADISFLQGDLFEPVTGQFDLIVSNPPYIEAETIGTLMPEVRDHEPRQALCGGADGLDFYRRIAKEAPAYLKPGGALYLEIGCEQGKAVMALLLENGFEKVSCLQDLAGLDRIVCGILC